VAHVKLYLTTEHQAALRAVCPSVMPARRIAPPSVSALWLESALVSGLGDVARVGASATGSVRGGRIVRIDDVRKADQLHVASAAQLDPRGVQVQGTSGFTAEQDMTALKPNGGVRGAPPRGRPV